MTLFKNKYRIESIRLEAWDYTNEGLYFVTICTKEKVCYFGNVADGKAILFNAGKIINEEWKRTEFLRSNVLLDEFVIMPNHLHGIIAITEKIETETSHRLVSTLKPNSLGSIVGQFKSVSTKRIHAEVNENFSWQPRFYEHIIRDEKELFNIRNYIDLNPVKWELDEYYKTL